jgi:hypothetical protein
MRTPTIFIPHGSSFDPSSAFGLRNFYRFQNDREQAFWGYEASPIYTGITVVRSGSGTRSVTTGGSTRTQTISYSQSHTFNRVFLADLVPTVNTTRRFSDGSYDLLNVTVYPAEDEAEFKNYVFGTNRPGRLLSNPKKHHLLITGTKVFAAFNYGSEVTDSDPPVNLTVDLNIRCPFFSYDNPSPTPPDVLPNEYDRWKCLIGIDPADSFGLDVTAYSATKWRDLKGTYTLTVNDSDIDPDNNLWDTNSVVHTAEWTIF